jgi:hypothetical protein
VRRIRHLVGARALNTFSRAVISSTVLWELYHRTSEKLVIGAVGAVMVIPVVLLFVPSGTLVDKGDRRALATVAAMITGLVGIGLAVASWFSAPVAVYLGLLFLQGCVTSVHAPASASLMAMSPRWVYAWVALTGLAAAALYRSLPKPRAAQPSTSERRDWRVGLRFIFASPLLLPAMTLDMVAVLFAGVTALLPVMATDVLHVGPFGYGILRASQPVGAVMMAIVGGQMPAWRRPGRVLLIVVALFGLATVGFGLSTSFSLSMALLIVCGALDNISVVIRVTLEQMVVPDAIRGRVSAVHYVFIGMSNELGAAESGVAAWAIGTVPAIVAGGAIAILAVGVVSAKWRALAAMPPLAELRPEA